MLVELASTATNSMLITLLIPLAFQLFMAVGMNRVWSLYLMLQIASNVLNITEMKIPASMMIIVQSMFYVSNFKIFENEHVQMKLREWFRDHEVLKE
jgi:hypothetical protein